MAVGPTQILIILVVVLLLFGASRLPQLGRNLGAGIRNFKDGLTGSDPDGELEEGEEPKQIAAPQPHRESGKKSGRKRKRPVSDEA